jgi:thiol:disulfide interchange protein DsbA
MMARALWGVLFGGLIAVQVFAFEEGTDYTKLATPQPTESEDKIEVLEVFLYTCPHCFHLEPTMAKWLASKPADVEFKRMPAVFSPRDEPYARAHYAAELMGKGEQFHAALFRALHVENRNIQDEDALVAFAEEQGIDGDKFRKTYDSFFVDMEVRRNEEMVKRYGVDAVPTLIVDGKYRTSPSQTGSQEQMMKVVDYLIGIESRQAPAEQAQPAGAKDS